MTTAQLLHPTDAQSMDLTAEDGTPMRLVLVPRGHSMRPGERPADEATVEVYDRTPDRIPISGAEAGRVHGQFMLKRAVRLLLTDVPASDVPIALVDAVRAWLLTTGEREHLAASVSVGDDERERALTDEEGPEHLPWAVVTSLFMESTHATRADATTAAEESQWRADVVWAPADEWDVVSEASQQHWIETGRYLLRGEHAAID